MFTSLEKQKEDKLASAESKKDEFFTRFA